MSEKRIEKLRRWSTGKSADMDMSLTWDDARLLLGLVDGLRGANGFLREKIAHLESMLDGSSLLSPLRPLLAVVEAADHYRKCKGRMVGWVNAEKLMCSALDAYHASKGDGDGSV